VYSFGAPVIAVYGRLAVLALVALKHTEGLAPKVIVGLAMTSTVNAVGGVLTHPSPELFRTRIVALYTPAAVFIGTVIPIGLPGNAVNATSVRPAASAAALKSIVYSFGAPVVAV
jgi:hypothetical protein